MGKSEVKSQQRAVYECVAPFAVWRGGLPVMYPAGYKVDEDDPIRRTHRDAFAPVTAKEMEGRTYRLPPEADPVLRNPEVLNTETKESEHAQVR